MEQHVKNLALQMNSNYGVAKLKSDLRLTWSKLQEVQQERYDLERKHAEMLHEVEAETKMWEKQKLQLSMLVAEQEAVAKHERERCAKLESDKDDLEDELVCQQLTVETMEEQLQQHETRISELNMRLQKTMSELSLIHI